MPRVSLRTLILMLELLIAVGALQYLMTIRSPQADAVWLAGNGSPPAVSAARSPDRPNDL